MKRNLRIAIILLCVLLATTFAATPHPHPSLPGNRSMLTYTWYTDENLSNPTGTVSDINTELNRLRNLFAGYTFSAYSSASLYRYEYGYYPGQSVAIIYSNMR